MSEENSTVTIYFDGACHLCSREMRHYFKRDKQGLLNPVDITAPDFDAVKEGLDPVKIHHYMHIKKSGTIFFGVDAFIEIWRVVPGYQWLARLANPMPVRLLLKPFYWIFARCIRPLLPKRKGVCELK